MPNPSTSRFLIIAFDGTTDWDLIKLSNLHKLYGLFPKDRRSHVAYYQQGYGNSSVYNALFSTYKSIITKLDKSFDSYLTLHLLDAYKMLMREYHNGDKIFIFGFARGAYTARALAGMLSKVGLLKEQYAEYFSSIWGLYTSDEHRLNAARDFKGRFSFEVTVEFLGVWETVPSLGYNLHQPLPFANGHQTVCVFRQALSLDECHIGPLILYQNEVERSMREQAIPKDGNLQSGNTLETDVKEVWFIGTHSDVGGGLLPDTSDPTISNISLRWMIREIVAAGHHDLFRDDEDIQNLFPRITVPKPTHQSQPTVQDVGVQENFLDPLDIEDFKQGIECTDSGRGRDLPPNPLFHISVRAYMKLNPHYKPKAIYEPGTEQYVP